MQLCIEEEREKERERERESEGDREGERENHCRDFRTSRELDGCQQLLTNASTDRDKQKQDKLCNDFKIDVLLQLASLCSQTSVVQQSLGVMAYTVHKNGVNIK